MKDREAHHKDNNSNPDSPYKSDSIGIRKYHAFQDARKFVHTLGLRNVAEWNAYRRSGSKPPDIPTNPSVDYRKDWKGWGDWLGSGLTKQKLTLTINKDVIERAKKVGFNISELTEQTLDALTYDLKNKEQPTSAEIESAYNSLFNYASNLLKKYNITVEVGRKSGDGLSDSLLLLDGNKDLLVVEGSDKESRKPIHISDSLQFLFKPTVILENLLLAIIECEEKNGERMIELQFAIRFLKALMNEK